MTETTSITLLETKRIVDDFRHSKGLNFSEALRFIIKDYFKMRSEKAMRGNAEDSVTSEIQQLKEEIAELRKDNEELKFNTDVALKMLIVIGYNDDDLRDEFVRYFPRYFKTN
jgi:hypothetical protein